MERPAGCADGAVPHNIDLEDDASMVDKGLENKRGAKLGEPDGIENQEHLVAFLGPVGHERLGDERELHARSLERWE